MSQAIDKEIEEFLVKISTNAIQQCDIVRLMEIGRQYGFKNITNRSAIWPVLLEVNIGKLQASSDFLDWRKNSEIHSEDYDQLKKDAMRSFFSFSKDIDHDYIKSKQQDLLEILDAFAKNQPRYKYFQGFHDVVSVFIGIFGSNIGYYISHRVATTYLRDSFLYTFQETVSIVDKLIYFITVKTDPDFEGIFQEFDDQKLGFTMPWIITWFAHSFDDINVITRIWDYLIASQASAIVYASAALILETKSDLINFCNESGSGFDLGTIHSFYQNLRSAKININAVISRAIKLQDRINIESITDTGSLPGETVMKEQNFVKLIGAHESFKQTKIKEMKKQKAKKRTKALFFAVIVFAVAVWAYSILGKKSFFSSDGGSGGL